MILLIQAPLRHWLYFHWLCPALPRFLWVYENTFEQAMLSLLHYFFGAVSHKLDKWGEPE